MDVRMDLAQIRISDLSDQQTIVLRERGGNRLLSIMIGPNEAAAIDRRVKGAVQQRPMTHDLLAQTIEALGGELEKIVIHALVDHTFYAKLVVRRDGQLIELDSRPSDAIAIGAGADTPLFVAEQVLRDADRYSP